MITIIHGDDISQSRNYFLELKQKEKEILSFNGTKITLTDLVQNIEGSGLFGNTKIIFIEELLSKNRKTDKSVKEILKFIESNSKSSNFVLWESKEFTKRDLFIFKNAIIKLFKLPKNIFIFLDSLRPKNSVSLLKLFHQVIDGGTKEEIILFMLQRQFRLLLALSDPGDQPIDEISRVAPWQMSKLQRQSKLFNIEDLKRIYKKLFEIELGHKTGELSLPLTQTIDFLLLEM